MKHATLRRTTHLWSPQHPSPLVSVRRFDFQHTTTLFVAWLNQEIAVPKSRKYWQPGLFTTNFKYLTRKNKSTNPTPPPHNPRRIYRIYPKNLNLGLVLVTPAKERTLLDLVLAWSTILFVESAANLILAAKAFLVHNTLCSVGSDILLNTITTTVGSRRGEGILFVRRLTARSIVTCGFKGAGNGKAIELLANILLIGRKEGAKKRLVRSKIIEFQDVVQSVTYLVDQALLEHTSIFELGLYSFLNVRM